MSRPLKRWPDYALENAENTIALLMQIDRDTQRVQAAIAEKDAITALVRLSDVRASALKAKEHIVRALSGDYEREAIPAWTESKQAMERDRTLAR